MRSGDLAERVGITPANFWFWKQVRRRASVFQWLKLST